MIKGNRLKGTTCLTAFICMLSAPALANPENGVVTTGIASITTNGNVLDVHQHTDKAVIDWRGFDINSGETTQFHQPGSGSIALNRVNSNSASHINGNLVANGNVIIINQNGVLLGKDANVDVNGLVVSTADIDNDKFMNSAVLNFDKVGNPNASIINEGSITIKQAGLVGFVAPHVENRGVIEAKMARVHLASGDTATVDFYGDNLMEVAVGDTVNAQLASNTGIIHADGGKVALTAAAGRNIVHSLINVDGEIRAQSISQKNGEIIIGAAGSNKTSKPGTSKVVIIGKLDASGKTAGETGGKITVTADEIQVLANANLDASGDHGGGNIKIGGDYQGTGTTQTAKQVYVEQGSIINNDAITRGDGGRTIIWSDRDTWFNGTILARGGSLEGDGGFAEVSGHDWLSYNGFTDLRSFYGSFGTLLLDPTDITISSATASNINFSSGTYTGTGATSIINSTTLSAQLDAADVTITTASAHAGNGDITIASSLNWFSNTSRLTLLADRDIIFNSSINASQSNTAGIYATAGRDIFFKANQTVKSIVATAGRNLTVSSGVTLTNGTTGAMSLQAAGGVTTNTGILTLNGILAAGSNSLTLISGRDSGGLAHDLTLTNSNLTYRSGTNSVGTINIAGFQDITINRDLTSTLASTIIANRNLTIGSGITVQSGSASDTILQAAGGLIGSTGILTNNGIISAGSGALTLTSGLNSSAEYGDLTLTTGNLLVQSGSIGSIAITGFRDITLSRDLLGSSSVNVAAQRNLTVGSGIKVRAGATSAMALTAANASTTSLGHLNMNGILNIGGGNLTLTSGVNSSGEGSDLTLTTSNLDYRNPSFGTASITGFRDIILNTDFLSSSAMTIAAQRNLTIQAGRRIQTGTTNAMSLTAANSGLGHLNMNGILSVGSGTLALTSGLNSLGEAVDLTLTSSNFIYRNSSVSTTNITGFRDINLSRNLASSASVTVLASRNLTVDSGITVTTGTTSTLSLRAAGGDIANTGILNMNGSLNTGSGSFTLLSGHDGSGNRANLSLTTANLLFRGADVAAFSVTGLGDILVDRSITSRGSNSITINAQRNLTIGSNAVITASATGGMGLRAAGGDINGQGVLTLNGLINANNGSLTMVSGLTAGADRADILLNNAHFNQLTTGMGGFGLSGFRDITYAKNITLSSGNISGIAQRDVIVNSGVTLTSGPTSGITLRAAGGDVAGTGVLILNGHLSIGSGTLSLYTGKDGSGNYTTDLTLNSGNLTNSTANIGTIGIHGFRDVTLDTAFNTTGEMIVNNKRHLTVGSNAVITMAAGKTLTLYAADSLREQFGLLTIDGRISLNTGSISLISGYGTGNFRHDFILNNSSNITWQTADIGGFRVSGYRDIDIQRDLITVPTSGTFIGLIAQRNLSVLNVATGPNNSLRLWAADGNASNVGVLTIGGTLAAGSAVSGTHSPVTLITGTDANGNRPDLVLNASNFTMQKIIPAEFLGWRDIYLNTDMTMELGSVVQAYRDIHFNANFTNTNTSAGTGYLTANAGRDITIAAGKILSSGSDITLVAGRNFLNYGGASALQAGLGGKWQVYSTSLAHDVVGSLPYNFRSFSCSYGDPCANNTGNGLIYKSAMPVNVIDNRQAILNSVLKTAQTPLPIMTTIMAGAPTTTINVETGPGLSSNNSTYKNDTQTSKSTFPSYTRTVSIVIAPEIAEAYGLDNWHF